MASVPLHQFLPLKSNQTTPEYLAQWEERWNKRVDQDVIVLGQGLGKVINECQASLSSSLVVISTSCGHPLFLLCFDNLFRVTLQRALDPSPSIGATSQLSLQVHTQTMMQSAESLLALTHQLKLMVLLSDHETPRSVALQEGTALKHDIELAKKGVEEALSQLGSQS